MFKGRRPRSAALLLSLTISTLCQPDFAHAFDTGPHQDMTRAAFQDEGFGPGSRVIEIAQVSNWFVDYYTYRPSFLHPPEFARLADQLTHMHFDNLTSPEHIRNAWIRLARNTRSGVLAAADDVQSARDAEERYERLVHLAVLIGASLHPVQDFYSHSNWVQLYPMTVNGYGTRTWFDTDSVSTSLRTGLYPSSDTILGHGGYDSGMNQDSYSRPHWPQAYVYAYSASRQWLRAVRQWVEGVDPAIWQDLLALQLPPSDARAVTKDLTVSYAVSLWTTPLEGKDGTWKGRGSGDFASLIGSSLLWMLKPNSILVRRFRGDSAYAPLVLGMDSSSVAPADTQPKMPRFALDRRAVEVRTLRVGMLDGDPDAWGNADLYAVVTIDGQRYVESTQQGRNEISPQWLSIGLVPESSGVVPVVYELFDEDVLGDKDDAIDIHPDSGRTHVEFGFDVREHELSGDLRGIHDDEVHMAVLQGGGEKKLAPALILLYVTGHALDERHAPAAAPPP
jgi:hypothetical protein